MRSLLFAKFREQIPVADREELLQRMSRLVDLLDGLDDVRVEDRTFTEDFEDHFDIMLALDFRDEEAFFDALGDPDYHAASFKLQQACSQDGKGFVSLTFEIDGDGRPVDPH